MRFKKMRASDLMTSNPQTVEAEKSLAEAAERMSEAKLHCLLVEAREEGESLGIITCKDIVQVLADSPEEVLHELCVEDVMTNPVISLDENMRITECIRMMRMVGIRRVPVTRQNQLVGILSYTDILRAAAKQGLESSIEEAA